MKHPIAFVLVVEAGDLELKSLLLVESIRNFAGQFQDAPIWVVQPRIGKKISQATHDALMKNNVFCLAANLNNKAWVNYNFANKAHAAAIVESLVSNKVETLVWLDSDIIFCQPPEQLILKEDEVVAVRPVDLVGVGSYATQPIDEFWQIIYETCGVTESQLWNLQTSVDRCLIRAYFNGGLIAVKPDLGIFQQYRDNLENLSNNKKVQDLPTTSEQYTFLEQSTLSATILANASKNQIKILEKNYNYPLHFQKSLPEENKISRLDEVVAVHYHHSFHNLQWRDFMDIKEPLKSWLLDRLPLPNLRKSRLHKMIGNNFINRTISRLS